MMAFEFVHISSTKPWQDEAAAKQVRSQAMRDFRRRQDSERARIGKKSTGRLSPSNKSLQWQYMTNSRQKQLQEEPWIAISSDELVRMKQDIATVKGWFFSASHAAPSIRNIANATWRGSTSPIVFYASCLESVGLLKSLDGVHGCLSESQITTIKVVLLREVYTSLIGNEPTFNDEILAALACLASYEIFEGSDEAEVHLRGIHGLLQSKSSEKQLQKSTTITMFLEIIDLLYAISQNKSPVLTKRPFNSSAHQNPVSPAQSLRASGDYLDEPSQLLPDTPYGTSCFHNETPISQASQLAVELYVAATEEDPIDWNDPYSLDERLYQVLKVVMSGNYTDGIILHARILLLALAFQGPHRSWYLAHLMRILYHVSWENWQLIKPFVFEFIDSASTRRDTINHNR